MSICTYIHEHMCIHTYMSICTYILVPRCVGVFYLLQKRRCEYIPHVHRVQAMYTGVHRHLLTGCLPIVTINVTCASAEHFAIACKYFVWLHPTTVLRGKVTVCCHGVQVSCTPFRHGTWETDTCVDHEGEARVVLRVSISHVPCLNGVQL